MSSVYFLTPPRIESFNFFFFLIFVLPTKTGSNSLYYHLFIVNVKGSKDLLVLLNRYIYTMDKMSESQENVLGMCTSSLIPNIALKLLIA